MIADVAHVLHAPLTDLLEMEWPEVLLWHAEAARLARFAAGGR